MERSPKRSPGSAGAGGAIIFRRNPRNQRIELLCGEKKTGKWKGYSTICFVSRLDPTIDVDLKATALRAIGKKTGGKLILGPAKFLKSYDREILECELELSASCQIKGTRYTNRVIAHIDTITEVYVCECRGGVPSENGYVGRLEFVDKAKVAAGSRELALDQPRMLGDLERFLR